MSAPPKQMSRCSDAIEIQPGPRWVAHLQPSGCCGPAKFPKRRGAQARFAWEYILAMLEKGEMNIADLVKVTTSLT
jgi:hypothetical protein